MKYYSAAISQILGEIAFKKNCSRKHAFLQSSIFFHQLLENRNTLSFLFVDFSPALASLRGKAFLDRYKTYYIWEYIRSFVIDSRSSRGKETKWDVCCFSVQYKDGLPGNPFLLAVYMRSGSSKQIYQSIGCRREQVCHQ